MNRNTLRLMLLGAAVAVCLLQPGLVGVRRSDAAAEKLPAGVTHRLQKIDQHMSRVESALAEGRANHNELGRAQGLLEEIRKQYPDDSGAAEVRAAEDRIAEGAAAIAGLEGDKAAAKEEQAKAEKAADDVAEQWADRLTAYKADDREGSKGAFGVPLSDPQLIRDRAPLYREAKALYAEFQATGIDKESHWKLRQADYDIRVSIENYESSIARLAEEAAKNVREARDWLAQQKARSEPNYLSADRLGSLRKEVEGIRLILPADSDQLRALNTDLAEVEKTQAEVEKIVLQERRMKPDIYKGADAAKIKELAKSIVLKEAKQAKILRAHIIHANWNTESAVEWTDTTKTAVQHRVTKGLNVQVALKKGADCFLYTLFVHRDTIGGAAGALTGHVMFRDKFLEQNLPK